MHKNARQHGRLAGARMKPERNASPGMRTRPRRPHACPPHDSLQRQHAGPAPVHTTRPCGCRCCCRAASLPRPAGPRLGLLGGGGGGAGLLEAWLLLHMDVDVLVRPRLHAGHGCRWEAGRSARCRWGPLWASAGCAAASYERPLCPSRARRRCEARRAGKVDGRGVWSAAAGLAARSQLSTGWGWQGTVARDRQAPHQGVATLPRPPSGGACSVPTAVATQCHLQLQPEATLLQYINTGCGMLSGLPVCAERRRSARLEVQLLQHPCAPPLQRPNQQPATLSKPAGCRPWQQTEYRAVGRRAAGPRQRAPHTSD